MRVRAAGAFTLPAAPSVLAALLLFAALPLLPLPAPAATADPAPPPPLEAVREGPVTVLHAPGEQGYARAVAERAVLHHARIRADLGLEETLPVTLLLLTGKTPGPAGEGWKATMPPWMGGMALSSQRFAVIRVEPGKTPAALDAVVAHELAHLVIAADYPRSNGWPLWFREGIAMRAEGAGGVRPVATLAWAALRGRLYPLAALERRFPEVEADARLAYAQSASFLAHLNDRHGAERFRRLMRELRRRNFEDAFAEAYGQGVSTLERQWRARLGRWHLSFPLLASDGVFWGAAVLLCLVAIVVRRRRSRKMIEAWEAEDAAEDGPPIPPDDDPAWRPPERGR